MVELAPPGAAPRPARLFVGGVAAGVSAEELAQRFAPFGAVTGVELVAGKLPGGGRDGARLRTAYVDLLPHSTAKEKDVQRCISLYNGCAWRGSTLRVERAQEHYTTRLGREWQLAAAAEAARASAAAAAAQAAASLATPEALAAARQATGAKLRDTMLLIQSRCTSKYMKVHACGGRYAGRHKRSFQRLPEPNAAAQPSAPLSAAELRSTLAASAPAPAAAPASKRGAPAASAGAPPAKVPRTQLAAAKPAAAAQDPWSRMFRLAAGVEAVEDVSDAEDAPPPQVEPVTQPEPAPQPQPQPRHAPAPPAAAAAARPLPPREPQRATAEQEERPQARKTPQPPRAATPELLEPQPPLTEAELDAAFSAERQAQMRVLASLGFLGGEPVAAAGGMGPAMPSPSSSEHDDPVAATGSDEDAVAEPPTRRAKRAAASAAVVRHTAAATLAPGKAGSGVVLDDDDAWARALRQAAGGDIDGEAVPPPVNAAPLEPRSAGRSEKGAGDSGQRTKAAAEAPASAPVTRKGVREALERTRLGEGRQGVYFAASDFSWRNLAVKPGEQTWSLLGPTTEHAGDAALPSAAAGSAQAPAVAAAAPAATPALPRPAAPAFTPCATVDLLHLGASFVGAGNASGVLGANREALLDDFKRKRRAALRSGKPAGGAKRTR